MSALGAILRGAAGRGVIDMTQRWDREQAMAREDARREREREEERQLKLELAQARGGGQRGSGGGAASRNIFSGAAGFDRAAADEAVAYAAGLSSAGDLQRVDDGTLWDSARDVGGGQGVDEYGNEIGVPADPTQVTNRDVDWEKARAKLQQRIQTLREAIVFGKDYKPVAEGMGERQRHGMLERYEGGNDRAGQAAVLSHGRGIFGGTSEVTRNEVTGDTTMTPYGEAGASKRASEAQRAEQQGAAAVTRASQPPRAGGGGARPRDPAIQQLNELKEDRIRLNQQVSALKQALDTGVRQLTIGGQQVPVKEAYQSALSRLLALERQIENQERGAAGPTTRPRIKILSVTPVGG